MQFRRSAFALVLLAALIFAGPVLRASSRAPVWGSKPVLAHLLLDPQAAHQLQTALGLSAAQRRIIVETAQEEDRQIAELDAQSQVVINNPALTITEKAGWVVRSGYNKRVSAILERNQQQLFAALGADCYQRLVDWVEARWQMERGQNSRSSAASKILARLIPAAAKSYPRSFEVYATRYDAGERKIVALPDKCLKFANGSALRCDGYDFGQGYSVAVSYEGNLVVALVGEAGPWNVDDNYWAKTSDPQPRRMFADLPLGVPEAQAAYFDGYNGGLDQFGRTVTSPVAIDISRALAADLGLGPGNNQVTVSFLWTEGWDSPSSQAAPSTQPGQADPGSASTAPVPQAITWQTATPNADGSIIHTVQSGQTLVGIAAVYGLPLADLLTLNGLTMQSVIQPNQQIVVRVADPTLTPSASPAPTQKPIATHKPTLTPTRSPSPTPAPIQTLPAQAAPPKTRIDPILVGMFVVLVVSVGLLIWGVIIQRRKN